MVCRLPWATVAPRKSLGVAALLASASRGRRQLSRGSFPEGIEILSSLAVYSCGRRASEKRVSPWEREHEHAVRPISLPRLAPGSRRHRLSGRAVDRGGERGDSGPPRQWPAGGVSLEQTPRDTRRLCAEADPSRRVGRG